MKQSQSIRAPVNSIFNVNLFFDLGLRTGAHLVFLSPQLWQQDALLPSGKAEVEFSRADLDRRF